ncbi:hypothetical protein BPO_p0073 (plasmid) [Bergeyella porcorum]|uniref:PKD domain-containing protein n=1 Tax=Bergeyella porcorum TaxID=1735111 RepID=A0AAU0F5D0_9FLAO
MDKSLGATFYQWAFDGGNPATSTEQNPKVSFSTPGTHTIKLTISNGKETYSTEKTITVKPAMTVDFDWSVDAIDNGLSGSSFNSLVQQINQCDIIQLVYQWGNPCNKHGYKS